MTMRGKIVLLTGATGGIGQAIARRLSHQGAILILVGRSAPTLNALARELDLQKNKGFTLVADIATHAGRESIRNAIKYTPADGVIVVNSWLRGKDVVLEVMDNGPGIPAEQQARVFDRFYRVGGDRHNSQTPGCGLGLSIVQQVVELHSAQIALTQSRFDHGLLAIVTFAAIAAPVAIKKNESGASRDSHNEKNN